MDFLPNTYFSVTHGIMLGRQDRKCVFRLRVKDVFEVLRFLK